MESRSKVAAAAASVVPFHCVICFDEFNLKDRTPMVLPCGHTYVCSQCTRRLKRCMECREPLFLSGATLAAHNAKPGNNSRNLNNSVYNRGGFSISNGCGSSSPGQTNPQPMHVPPQMTTFQLPPSSQQASACPANSIPLPIPKNVVLMAMMEAAQRQAMEESQSMSKSEDVSSDDEEEEFNLDRIISGMATLSGPCGTYSVVANKGLVVLPNDPRMHQPEGLKVDIVEDKGEEAQPLEEEEKKQVLPEEEDEAGIQSELVVEATATTSTIDDVECKLSSVDPFSLRKGQTVQVVDFHDGVAKLARGQGYIIATSSELVKVGGPMEPCCRLEGLLDTITSRGKDLQSTLDENRQIEENLLQQIQAELEKEPVHPVISQPIDYSLSSDSKDSEASHPSTPTGAPESAVSLKTPESQLITRVNPLTFPDHPNTLANMLAEDHRIMALQGVSPPTRSPNSIDNADIERESIHGYRRAVSEDDLDQLAFGCGAAFLAPAGWGDGWTGNNHAGLLHHSEASANDYSDSVTRLRPRSAADSLLMHAAPTLTSSFDGIDFRTGMSCHRGLGHTASKQAGNSPTPRGRQVRMMMSQHRGIAAARAVPPRHSPTSTSAQSFAPRFSPFPGSED